MCGKKGAMGSKRKTKITINSPTREEGKQLKGIAKHVEGACKSAANIARCVLLITVIVYAGDFLEWLPISPPEVSAEGSYVNSHNEQHKTTSRQTDRGQPEQPPLRGSVRLRQR